MGSAETFSAALRECFEESGGIRTKNDIAAWINQKYPNKWRPGTLVGHLYGCSVNNPKGIEHHPGFPRFLFALGNSRYELYDPQKHGVYENGHPAGEHTTASLEVAAIEVEQPDAGSSFAYESHLRDYLARNLSILEPHLQLWHGNLEESVEYDVDGRRIDILGKDFNGVPVVIELKVSRGHEKTIGQCLYYRGKVRELLKTERVRIFIVAEEISPELRIATKEVSDVELFEYSLSMTVKHV